MSDFIRAADRAMGLELQLEELVEQRKRAQAQGLEPEMARMSAEITELQNQLAEAAEVAVTEPPGPVIGPTTHDAEALDIHDEPT